MKTKSRANLFTMIYELTDENMELLKEVTKLNNAYLENKYPEHDIYKNEQETFEYVMRYGYDKDINYKLRRQLNYLKEQLGLYFRDIEEENDEVVYRPIQEDELPF